MRVRAELGNTLFLAGKHGEAEPVFRRVLALYREHPGRRPAEEAGALNGLALIHAARGDFKEAERLLGQALALARRGGGEARPMLVLSTANLGQLRHLRGDLAAAEARRALEIVAAAVPADSPELVAPQGHLGSILVVRGRAAQAEPLLREALAGAQRVGNAFLRGAMQSALGECLLALGRRAEAAPLLREGHRTLLAAAGAENPYTRRAAERLARLEGARPPGPSRTVSSQ